MKIVLILFMIQVSTVSFSQNFSKIDRIRIDTKLILPENYSPVKLPEGIFRGKIYNKYNPENNDTFLDIIRDGRHGRYHILVQTDFFGNIEYVAVNNSLLILINNKDKPKFAFEHCLEELNNGFSNQQENIEKLVNCVLERMEICSQK